MRARSIFIVLLLLLSTGCMTATVRPEGGAKVDTDASWQERQHFFVYGLVGESRIDVQEVCSGRDATQLQTRQQFVDGLLGLVTIGIYAPRTAKVWCE